MSHDTSQSLEHTLDRVFAWIGGQLHNFATIESDRFEHTLGSLKPLGELVLALEILNSHGYREAECLDLLKESWIQVGEGELLLIALASRPDLIVLSGLYANFRRFGLVHERLESLISHLLNTVGCQNLEFPYWRRLDLIHATKSLGIGEFPENPDRGCWFYGGPEPWMMSDDVAYAITHDVFYLTDFGRCPERLSEVSRQYIATWLPAWLALFRDQPNWDIYSELIMVASCLIQPFNMSHFCAPLIAAQENDGLIPSPPGAGQQLLDFESNPSEERKRFLSNYHTCLVAAMALAMATQKRMYNKRMHPIPSGVGGP